MCVYGVETIVLCAYSSINLRGIVLIFIDPSIDPKLLILIPPIYLNSVKRPFFTLAVKA